MAEPAGWEPTWEQIPGDILAEVLDDRGMSQAELARRMARPLKTINEIIKGKAAITPDTAIQLERVTGVSAGFWNGLEAQFRATAAAARARAELATHESWAQSFPLAALRKLGRVGGRTPVQLADSLLSFFAVSSQAGWEQQWRTVTARYRKPHRLQSAFPALTAWLRLGDLQAGEIETDPFNPARLATVVPEVAALSQTAAFSLAVKRLRGLLASAGVAFVLTPELPGVHVSGAARWLTADRAVVQVSLRYKSDDQFWFTVLHEVGHVLQAKRAQGVIDEEGSEETSTVEESVNAFARDALLPPALFDAFVQRGDLSKEAVEQLAGQAHVSAGVVVGQLQGRGVIPFGSGLNVLKRAYR